ncbi:hypothetical protein CFFPNG_02025 [Methylorubrum aminovorans]
MSAARDFDRETQDVEGHRYAYDFDLNVMHKYMMRAFEPFFRPGRLLELGSFRGDFTRRLMPFFDDITCVEASGEAIAASRERLGEGYASFRRPSRALRCPSATPPSSSPTCSNISTIRSECSPASMRNRSPRADAYCLPVPTPVRRPARWR